jgi:hypothetical protein
VSGLIVLAVFLTGSRGGFLAVGGTLAFVVLGLIVYLLTSRPKLIFPVLIGVVVVSVLGALLLHFDAHDRTAHPIYICRLRTLQQRLPHACLASIAGNV